MALFTPQNALPGSPPVDDGRGDVPPLVPLKNSASAAPAIVQNDLADTGAAHSVTGVASHVTSAVTTSAVATVMLADNTPAFMFGGSESGAITLANAPGPAVQLLDPQFFSFSAGSWTSAASGEGYEVYAQTADVVVGPPTFHFAEAANWSSPESDSGGSWFADWLYDLLA